MDVLDHLGTPNIFTMFIQTLELWRSTAQGQLFQSNVNKTKIYFAINESGRKIRWIVAVVVVVVAVVIMIHNEGI